MDLNKAISPILAVRVNALFQDANVAGRNFVFDNRDGVAASVVFKPLTGLKLSASYAHVYSWGPMDYGVPYARVFFGRFVNRPVTEGIVPRNTWYGFVNRDRHAATQDFGTLTAEYDHNENFSIVSRLRVGRSELDYIATGPTIFQPNSVLQIRPPSGSPRRAATQVMNVLANQTDATLKFETGPVKHALVAGVEFAREDVTRTNYARAPERRFLQHRFPCNLFLPPNLLPFPARPFRNPANPGPRRGRHEIRLSDRDGELSRISSS